jgi:FkbM family methyltransferase
MNIRPERKEGLMRNSIRFARNIFRTPHKHEPISGSGSTREYDALKKYLTADIRTVIDVGAHIGEFAQFARTCLPEAAIVCIEPNEQACNLLKEKMKNDALLTVHCCAAGEREEHLPLQVSAFSPVSSMLKPSQSLRRYFPYIWGWSSIAVPVCRLDDIVPDAQPQLLLKIDVQGFEDRVLRGAESILRAASVIIIELSYVELYEGQMLAGDIANILGMYGFRQMAVQGELHDWLTRKTLQADAVFVKEAH